VFVYAAFFFVSAFYDFAFFGQFNNGKNAK